MNEDTHHMMNMIKMKLLFSSNNGEIYNHIYQCFVHIFIIFLINYITSVFSQDTNYANGLMDSNMMYKLKSLFVKENKIEIEGRRCFKSGTFASRYDNLFSFSFNAIWQYVEGKMKNNNDDIYSLKECGETNRFYDEYVDEMKTNTKTTYIVNQQKPFHLEKGIYCRVIIAKEKMESVNGNNKTTTNVENIKIILFSYTQKLEVLKTFLEEVTQKYINALDDSRIGKHYIYTYEGGLDKTNKNNEYEGQQYLKTWSECEFKSNTNFSNIFFKQKDELLNKIHFFIHNKGWYEYHGKPYTLGIGLSGPPGTGKTSIIKSIAHALKRHIVVIPLNKINTISEFTRVFYENRYIKANKENSIGFKDKIIIFEDIDCMTDLVFSRDEDMNMNTNINGIKTLKEMMNNIKTNNTSEKMNQDMITSIIKACKEDNYELLPSMKVSDNDKLTLSFILNVIDGIKETPGRIIVMTSNHYNKLDKALIRPGRIDICLEMELASREIIQEMFNHFYSYNYTDKNKPVNWNETIYKAGFKIQDIPDKLISQAEVVQCFDCEPLKFIQNIIDKGEKINII